MAVTFTRSTARDAVNATITFTASDGTTSFTDAIIVTLAQYDAMSIDDIKGEMQARWDNYLVAITPPPVSEDGI